MPPPMRSDHGNTSRIVALWMGQYQWKTLGVKGADGATVKLDLQGELQADHLLRISAELGGQTRVDEQGYLTGAPEMVVEIARSSRLYDLNQKKADYERVGVREYVVVELKPDRVHWFIRRGKRFQVLRPDRGGIYRSEVFPGLWLDAQALDAEELDRLMEVLNQGLASPEHVDFAAKLASARVRTKDAK
jgi:Uma2 family endonuclease